MGSQMAITAFLSFDQLVFLFAASKYEAVRNEKIEIMEKNYMNGLTFSKLSNLLLKADTFVWLSRKLPHSSMSINRHWQLLRKTIKYNDTINTNIFSANKG